jgi:hypothetical protein
MQFLNLFRIKILSLLAWLGFAGKIHALAASFPGMDDEERVRLWVLENADGLQSFAVKTDTLIDDKILATIQQIAHSPKMFPVIFRLMKQAYDCLPVAGQEPVFGKADFISRGNADHISRGDAKSAESTEITKGTTNEFSASSAPLREMKNTSLRETETAGDAGIAEAAGGDLAQFADAIIDGEVVENPVLILSAVGLLLQVIMLIRSRRRNTK